MKIVDKTPFYKDGELSLVDRGKAIMQFGIGWFKEIDAQKTVIAVMDRILDKNYTILRNVTPPGLDATIPIVLVGPTGVYVMCVTPLTGMYRVKGDQWGTISGNAFKPAKPNLLTRTERMARVVQTFLQRQGYADLPGVEAILLCSDPSINVDSLRPIVRIVMRDALERFTVSVTQARIVLSSEGVYDVINRLLNPPAPPEGSTAEAAAPSVKQEEDPYAATYALLGSQPAPITTEDSIPPARSTQTPPVRNRQIGQRVRPRKRGLTSKQWTLLIGMFIIWCLLAGAAAIFLVLNSNLLP